MNDQTSHKPDEPAFTFKVESDDVGTRLDAFLGQKCTDISRNKIQTDLKAQCVSVDGRQRPKGYALKKGQVVTYQPAPVQEMVAVAQDIPLDVVYRDDSILILNKPVGMVVHPAIGHPDGTVVNALLHLVKDLDAGENPLRPGIVHRLDRDTSGLMAVALTQQAHAHLSEQLRDRRMGRQYMALSWGSWSENAGTLTGDIGRHPQARQKMAVVGQGGRPAVTHFQVLAEYGFVQLCQVKLETGRTHQIRVHFAHNHHPIVGDPMYGDDIRAKGVHSLDRTRAAQMVKAASRQMLHASQLELVHPVSGESMAFTAPIADDMESVLTILKG